MNCPRCGNLMYNNSPVCNTCGYRVNVGAQQPPYGQGYAPYGQQPPYGNVQPPYGQGYTPYVQPTNDKPDTGINVLSFFIPLVGLILYFVDKSTKPIKAKAELKWSLIGWGVSIGLSIITSIIMAVFSVGFFAANEEIYEDVYDDYGYYYDYDDYYNDYYYT